MSLTTFESLGLCEPLLTALKKNHYQHPTPIQEQAIPAVLAGRDIMAAAQTGTGKTAAFTLPVLHRLQQQKIKARSNQVRTLIITPTRELASQIFDNVMKYGDALPFNYNVVFGGVKINPQMMKLRRGTDILIATPGRLLDLYKQNAVKFDQLDTLILDEADRMLDMGFIHDIKRILAILPKKRQNLLFSATFSDDIRALAKNLVNDPAEITVTPPNSTVERIEQCLYEVNKADKTKLLIHLIKSNHYSQVLVFSRTKHGANKLTTKLIKQGIPAAAIHGNKSQNVRTRALADFKDNSIQVLVATDIAARGIDIAQLPFVINFDLPNVAEDYVHRIGRTGRAGKSGLAISLVCNEESKQLSDIEKLIKLAIPRRAEEGFSVSKSLPVTDLTGKVKKPKKPKRPKIQSGLNKGNGHRRKPNGTKPSDAQKAA
ncbi:DEAD/DEAH box helicase [Alteromonas sediminis]|uniref:DEAD-box ATP-dependent RNA helicase RhpA n=1 Tax=Alteromonas sediminis TaxID=2259342 RepID=A0A3N5YB16_9ALTE|nr:DEAD/DEAH box helicase [Alteromonas sediminis]